MEQKIFIAPEHENLTILTGNALPQKEPVKIVLSGNINSVSAFLTKRNMGSHSFQKVDLDRAVVIVDRDNGTIQLKLDPENHYGTEITGKLEVSPEVKKFQINEAVELSREEVIKLFRFNRLFFKNEEASTALIKAFQKISVNAIVEMSKEDDTRGNVNASLSKKVNTGIPESFVLNIPIYKGQPNESIEVNICLDVVGTRVIFWFESIQLVELLELRKDEIFTEQLSFCEPYPIIEK